MQKKNSLELDNLYLYFPILFGFIPVNGRLGQWFSSIYPRSGLNISDCRIDLNWHVKIAACVDAGPCS